MLLLLPVGSQTLRAIQLGPPTLNFDRGRNRAEIWNQSPLQSRILLLYIIPTIVGLRGQGQIGLLRGEIIHKFLPDLYRIQNAFRGRHQTLRL